MVPQYLDGNGDPASGYVLKAYQVGTTTNIDFATTREGTTTASSIALNSQGFPEVSGSVVIPHLDQDYKLALYPSQTAADSDTGAVWTVDDIDLIQTTDTSTAADYNVWPLTDYGGAYFDGSNDYLTRGSGLTGASDGKKGALVAFVTFDTAPASAIEYVLHGTGGAFIFRRDADGVFRIIAENSGGSTILNMATSTAYETADTVYCVMASWDLATPGSNQLYVNDVSDVVTTTFTNDTIDYTVADWAVGADVGGSNKITGNVLSVWFDPTGNLDFDTETNRRKFLDEQDNPTFVGGYGQLPTGSQPIVYLGMRGEASFETNLGSGGDFTENGTMAAASVTFDGQYDIGKHFPNVNADVTATDEDLNILSEAFGQAGLLYIENTPTEINSESPALSDATWTTIASGAPSGAMSVLVSINVLSTTTDVFDSISAHVRKTGSVDSPTNANKIGIAVGQLNTADTVQARLSVQIFVPIDSSGNFDIYVDVAGGAPTTGINRWGYIA